MRRLWIVLLLVVLSACGGGYTPCTPMIFDRLQVRCHIAPVAGIAGHGGLEDTQICEQWARELGTGYWYFMPVSRYQNIAFRWGSQCVQGEVMDNGSPVPGVFLTAIPTPTREGTIPPTSGVTASPGSQ